MRLLPSIMGLSHHGVSKPRTCEPPYGSIVLKKSPAAGRRKRTPALRREHSMQLIEQRCEGQPPSLFVLNHSALDNENSIRSKGSPRTEMEERWGMFLGLAKPAFCAQ